MVTKSKTPARKVPTKNAPERAMTKAATAPRKRATRSATAELMPAVRATTVRFFLADDMRQEVNGKVTAVGLYADNVIVAEMSADDPDPTPERVAGLPSLSILASVSVRPGQHSYNFEADHVCHRQVVGKLGIPAGAHAMSMPVR